MSRLDRLDQELARWESVAAATVNNVYALYEHPAYRTLSGAGTQAPPPQLTGRTAAEVGPAVRTISELLGRALELKKVVERAAELRKSLPLVFRDERMAEIENLLQGPSITLPPADPLPLADRGLLAGVTDPQAAPPAISPTQLVEHMKGAFEQARDCLFAVDRAWASLPGSLEALEAEWRELQALAEPLGPHAPTQARASLAEVGREMANARAALRTDPLGVAETFERRISPKLHSARAGFELVARQWRDAQEELAAARLLAAELGETHAATVTACAECRLKLVVEPPPPGPAEETQVVALGQWLNRLSEKIAHGSDWPPARIGLARWRTEAAEILRADRAATDAANSLLRERQSLRGLFEALNAKASARGLSEHPDLVELTRHVRGFLWSRPTPLAQAREGVAEFGKRLRRGVP